MNAFSAIQDRNVGENTSSLLCTYRTWIIGYVGTCGGKWKSMRVIEEPPAIGIEEQLRMEEARTGV